jgi:hypothetical protein
LNKTLVQKRIGIILRRFSARRSCRTACRTPRRLWNLGPRAPIYSSRCATNGVDAHGYRTGGQRHQPKQGANPHKCPRIVRPHVIEHSGHQPCDRHGRTDADDCAGKRQQKSSPGYKPHQFAPLRTKGHANTQLSGTPRPFVREQSIQADARQYQGQERKEERRSTGGT